MQQKWDKSVKIVNNVFTWLVVRCLYECLCFQTRTGSSVYHKNMLDVRQIHLIRVDYCYWWRPMNFHVLDFVTVSVNFVYPIVRHRVYLEILLLKC